MEAEVEAEAEAEAGCEVEVVEQQGVVTSQGEAARRGGCLWHVSFTFPALEHHLGMWLSFLHSPRLPFTPFPSPLTFPSLLFPSLPTLPLHLFSLPPHTVPSRVLPHSPPFFYYSLTSNTSSKLHFLPAALTLFFFLSLFIIPSLSLPLPYPSTAPSYTSPSFTTTRLTQRARGLQHR